MAKYKVLKDFRDIRNKTVYEADSEIELTEERAAEVNENLKDKGTFIKLVETPEAQKDTEEDKFDREAAKERLKELGVEFSENAKNATLKKLLDDKEQNGYVEGDK